MRRGQDRLTQLHEFLDTLEEQTASNAENWFLGALAAASSDFAWGMALDSIRATFTPATAAAEARPMTTTTVQIQLTCPEWCTVTAEQHLADLWDLDGYCIHFGPVATVHDQVGYDEPLLGKHQFHDPAEVWFTSETHHDGRESAPPIVRVETPHEMSMQQALAVADALRDAVTLYESAGGRVDR